MTGHGVDCAAPPEQLWALVARPDQWSRWSPYVRGAEGLGSPEVQAGSQGKVILAIGIKLTAEVTEVIPGRSWSWKVGGIVVDHIVTAIPGGSRLSMPVRSTGGLWKPAALVYGPAVGLIIRRIVRIAEREE